MQTLDIKKEISQNEVHVSLDKNFNKLSADWFMIQQYWLTNAYSVYRDHEKYLILFYLAKKVFEIYSSHYRILNWNEFFNIQGLNVGKISINVISRELKISRETARRKIGELISDKTIIKNSSGFILNTKKNIFTKSREFIKHLCGFLNKTSEILKENKIIQESIKSSDFEKNIIKSYSYAWKLWFDRQIPWLLDRKEIFNDLESFHIWALCIQNQNYEVQKYIKSNNLDLKNTSDFFYLHSTIKKKIGINAMSLSAISNIPRATVIRKLKILLKNNFLTVDEYKLYHPDTKFLTSSTALKLNKSAIIGLSNFVTKTINLTILSN
tara:strand:+ start:363 stop:1337 length:975 start_codon:yes stop_codon:yes gene_type:complete